VLSHAVLTAASKSFVAVAVKAHQNALTQADLRDAIGALTLLRDHLREVGFDANMVKAFARLDRTRYLADSPVIEDVYKGFAAADSSFTLGEVTNTFARLLAPDQVDRSWAQLSTVGLTPTLTAAIQALEARLPLLPVSAHGGAQFHNVALGICDKVNFLAQIVGTAAAALAFGCLPEPFFEVICPAVVGLGYAGALLGVVSWIAC
jgi:hypothetical protein